MKGKKIVLTLMMLLIVAFTVGVRASEYWWDAYSTIRKGEDAGELYNSMPTTVEKGDIISVKVVVKNANGWELGSVENDLRWDSNAFEIVETDERYYKVLNNDYHCHAEVNDNDSLYYSCDFDGYVATSEEEEILEFKFKVKKNVADGVYKIHQNYYEYGFQLVVNGRWETAGSLNGTLYYQVGKPKFVSNYTKDKIGDSTYIIGEHLFTREGSDEYNGILTTEYIMLASKSIASDDKKDMIVYAKNARGKWINAITDEEITPPEEFKITYQDMKATYQENGIYSDSNDKNILRYVQLTKDKAIITIENDKEKVEGMATVRENVADLNVNGKSYTITITESGATIQTADEYIGNKSLQKRANYLVSDLYDNMLGLNWGESYPKMYLNSGHSGKYTNDKYEIYLVRVGDNAARICVKEKGENECVIDTTLWNNRDGWYLNGEETTYGFSTEELEYGINWLTDELEVKCEGACTSNPYKGTYTKEKSLTMEEALEAWVNNERYFKVILDPNSDNYDYEDYEYVLENHTLDYYEPYRDGYRFVEWQLDGHAYDFNTPVTKPITLVAKWEIDSLAEYGIPMLYHHEAYIYDGEKYVAVLGDVNPNKCRLISENSSERICDMEYGELYEVDISTGQYTKIMDNFSIVGHNNIRQSAGTLKYYVLRGYKEDGEGNREYTRYSDYHIVDLTDAPIIPTPNITQSNEIQHENGFDRYTIAVNNADVYSDSDYTRSYFVSLKNSNNIYEGWPDTTVVPDSGENGKSLNETTYVDVENGTTKEFMAEVRYEKFGKYYYSAYSNLITLTSETPAVQYTVTFDSNGGSQVDSQTVDEGGKATQPTNPTKMGYTFAEWQLNGHAYDFDAAVTSNITLTATWVTALPTPTLSNSMGDYGWSLFNIITEGYYATEEAMASINGWELYRLENETPVLVIDHVVSKNGSYTARAFIYGEDNEKIYSEYSNYVEFTDEILPPTISVGMADSYYHRGIIIDNYNSYCNGECNGSDSDEFIVEGYEVYEKNGTDYNKIATVDGMYSYDFTAEPNANKTYVVRAFTMDLNNNKVYSGYSNEVVVNTVIAAPVIERSHVGSGETNIDLDVRPLWFHMIGSGTANDPFTPAFAVDLNGDYSIHRYCNSNDSTDCEYLVDDYDWFEKKDSELKLVYEGGFGGEATVYIPEGYRKTFVAKAYILGANNQKVYSEESNEITIDLTNASYTFETIESIDDASKVYIKAYANDYEIDVHGIKINGTVYDDSNNVDKSVIEGVDTIVLGLDQVSQSDPNTFIVERTATRKN